MGLDRLREVAEAATEGPWEADATEVYGPRRMVWVGETLDTDKPEKGRANAEHIAAFDPPTALALLDVAEAAEAYSAYDGDDNLEALDDALARLREVAS